MGSHSVPGQVLARVVLQLREQTPLCDNRASGGQMPLILVGGGACEPLQLERSGVNCDPCQWRAWHVLV